MTTFKICKDFVQIQSDAYLQKRERGTEWTINGDGPEAGGGVIRGTLWGPSAVSRQRSPLQNAFGRCVCAARSGCSVDESRCVPPWFKKLINEFRRIRVIGVRCARRFCGVCEKSPSSFRCRDDGCWDVESRGGILSVAD